MTNVIVADRAEEQAYELGFEQFEAFEGDDEVDLSSFHDTATYVNSVLPRLRALAGHDDSGPGTYQIGGEIVIVDAADLDDDPISGDDWTAEDYYSVLVDRWHDGARDALEGRERGDSL